MKKPGRILLTVTVVLLLLFTTSCTSTFAEEEETVNEEEMVNAEEETETIETGTVEIWVTDPPPADVKTAVVQLTKVQVHRAAADNPSDSDETGEWITLLEEPASFDLMEIIGVEKLLGSIDVPTGKYTQIRMDVTEVTGNITDDTPYTAEVPGDKLKIVRPFTVENGTVTALTLDFDGEKSLIRTGNGKFKFNPVVQLSIEKEEKGKKEKEQEQGQKDKELEFEGTIEVINGDNWTMTIDGETRTVDVSGAEIKGEPAVGLQAEIEGTVVDDVIIATEVEIKEPEE